MASVNRRLKRAAERGKDISNVRMRAKSHGGRLKDYQKGFSLNLYADRYEDGTLDLSLVNGQKGGGKV